MAKFLDAQPRRAVPLLEDDRVPRLLDRRAADDLRRARRAERLPRRARDARARARPRSTRNRATARSATRARSGTSSRPRSAATQPASPTRPTRPPPTSAPSSPTTSRALNAGSGDDRRPEWSPYVAKTWELRAVDVGLDEDEAGDRARRRGRRASTASISSASCSIVSRGRTRPWSRRMMSSGPRCSVRRWMMPHDARMTRRSRRGSCATTSGVAASPTSRLAISIASKIAITTSRMPMARLPAASQRGSSVTSAMHDAEQRDDQADERAGVLEQHDRQLRDSSCGG